VEKEVMGIGDKQKTRSREQRKWKKKKQGEKMQK
jgi:hypothetical protein